MPQILRPISDSSVGNWRTETGSASNLFASLDETVASDTDYVQSGPNPSSETVRFALSQGNTDPNVSTGYQLTYRYGKTGTDIVDITVRIVEGASTVIASWDHLDVAVGPTQVTQTLTTAQANAITNHNNLFAEIIANTGGGGGGGGGGVGSLSSGVQYSLWWVNNGD